MLVDDNNPPQPNQPDDHLEARIFALSISDDGPSVNTQPHPLWNARPSVQHPPPAESQLPLQHDIQASVSRIISSRQRLAATRVSRPKVDRKQKTELKILDEMDGLIVQCNMKLSLGSQDCVAFAKKHHARLCERLTRISRRTDFVQRRKADVRAALDSLRASFDSFDIRPAQPGATYFDSCECRLFPRVVLCLIHRSSQLTITTHP